MENKLQINTHIMLSHVKVRKPLLAYLLKIYIHLPGRGGGGGGSEQ